MKKVLLLLLIFCAFIFSANAQKGKVAIAQSYIDQGLLDKAMVAIKVAETNEKTINWADTWFVKGKLCQAVFQSDPPFSSLYSDPLQEAYASYEKALTLDYKSSIKKRLKSEMVYNTLAIDFYKQGCDRFQSGDYNGALNSFKSQILVMNSGYYSGALDTGMYYNAGLSAFHSKKFSEAIGYFERCIEYGYLGMQPYFDIEACYLQDGDTVKAENMIKEMIAKYPDNTSVYLLLIDLYLKGSRNDEARIYTDIARQKDPENYMLLYVSGVINLNQSNHDEAIGDLRKSIQKKPDMYDSQYAMALAYTNKAVDMNAKANEIDDVKKYNEAVEEVNFMYAKAVPYMEKANELKPDDVYTLGRLQELYYRLRLWNPAYNQKYLDIKARLAAIRK